MQKQIKEVGLVINIELGGRDEGSIYLFIYLIIKKGGERNASCAQMYIFS